MRQDRKFANFVSKADDKLNEIYTLYDKISYRAAKLFDLSQELFAMSGKRTGASTDLLEMDEMYGGDLHESNPVDSSLSEIKSYFLEQAAQLEKQLFFFISTASLYCCLSTSSRKKHLSRMGFSITAEEGTSWLAYIIPMLLLFPVFGVLFFFTYYGSSGSIIFERLMMVSMITLTYTVAVGVAVCIKTRLWFANIFYQNFKSIRAVVSIAVSSVIIGAIAIVFVLPVITFFKFFLSGGDLNVVISDIIDNTYPWLVLPGTAAFITAVMIDENYLMMFRTEKSGTRRWAEGALSAVTLAVAMLIVHPLLKDQAPDAPLAALVLAQGLAGVIIGLSIPHWYRSRYKHPRKTGHNSSFSLQPSSRLRFHAGLK
jgi:hypothetical protein